MKAELARQLSHPRGWRGRLVAALLNRRNHNSMAAAVQALSLPPGATAADLGFGGGTGLSLLLGEIGERGRVHGVDVSATMVNRAAHQFRAETANGRLRLHTASLTDLPLPDTALDGAIMFNTIYYIAELEQAFSELHRVLSNTGHTVVGFADPEAMAARPFAQHGLWLRAVSEITDQLQETGLSLADHIQLDHRGETFHLLVAKPKSPPS